METQSLVNEYERNNHSVGLSMWHFEWCTKYRYKMFRKEKYLKLVEACIRRAASLHSIKKTMCHPHLKVWVCDRHLFLGCSKIEDK